MTDSPFAAPSHPNEGGQVPATQGPEAQAWQGSPVPTSGAPLPPPPPPAGYGYSYTPPPTRPSAAAVPPPYAPPSPPGSTEKNWMGIAALVLSLATVVFGVTCIGGIILGHMGLAAAKRGEANNRGLALAGAIIGWVLLSLGLLFVGAIIVFVLAFSQSSYESTY